MPLWIAWFDAVRALRPATKRFHTFLWMILALIGLSCRPERAGVTSLARLLGFGNRGYRRFLHLFHSRALELDALTAGWAKVFLMAPRLNLPGRSAKTWLVRWWKYPSVKPKRDRLPLESASPV